MQVMIENNDEEYALYAVQAKYGNGCDMQNMQNMTDMQNLNMTNMSSMIQTILQKTPPLCDRPSLFNITDMAKNMQNMNPAPF